MSQYYGIPDYPVCAPNNGHGAGYYNGMEAGRLKGRTAGRQEGWEDGWEDGRKTGWDQGWNECLAIANPRLDAYKAVVDQHVADKNVMAEQLKEQHALILKLSARIDEVEQEKERINSSVLKLMPLIDALSAEKGQLAKENKKLQESAAMSSLCAKQNLALNLQLFADEKRKLQQTVLQREKEIEALQSQAEEDDLWHHVSSDEATRELIATKDDNENLRAVVTALKEANERLQTEVSQLDEKYKERTKEYTDQVVNCNRNMVFMNAVRLTLEHVTAKNDAQAHEVRKVFAEKYSAGVSRALGNKDIDVAPEKDASFGKLLPKTQKFILEMLSSVAANASQTTHEQTMEHSDEQSLDM